MRALLRRGCQVGKSMTTPLAPAIDRASDALRVAELRPDAAVGTQEARA